MATNVNVMVDREKYLGGSEISAILGISSFTTREKLLKVKAGLETVEFKGNKYTRYGDTMEAKITKYVNSLGYNFVEDTIIYETGNGVIDYRCNYDGLDTDNKVCLEVKTTSHTFETIIEYKHYLVQLLYGMWLSGFKKGVLAVYERPESMSVRFDKERLQVFEIDFNDYQDIMFEITQAIDLFVADLKDIKENGIKDTTPAVIKELGTQIELLEHSLEQYNQMVEQYNKAKENILDNMILYDIKTWNTPNGTKFTAIDGVEASVSIIDDFDLDKFMEENPELYNKYIVKKEKKANGRKPSIRITVKKEGK